MLIYRAMGWPLPVYAHIPLIHGPDGKKLSKRHGALGVEEYRRMGYPAAGMRNYLARLGWSHGDDEVFTDAQALEWFDLSGIGKSPARLDFKKLDNTCGQHIAMMDDAALQREVQDFLATTGHAPLDERKKILMEKGMYCLKQRAKTFPELIDKAAFIMSDRPIEPEPKAVANLDDVSCRILTELTPQLQTAKWSREDLETVMNRFADDHGTKFAKLAGPLRAALAGRSATPSVFDMMLVLGRDESIARLEDAARGGHGPS
jgi:glutamyl-tRNA synthetase